MRLFEIKLTLVTLLVCPCLTFGQNTEDHTSPHSPLLAVDGQIREFDPEFIHEPTPEQESAIRQAAQRSLDSALANGYQVLGGMNLKELMRSFAKVKIKIVDSRASAVGAGVFSVRVGSAYDPRTQTVFINEQTLQNLRSSDLLTHEFVGALGFDDEAYFITSVLNLASRTETAIRQSTQRLEKGGFLIEKRPLTEIKRNMKMLRSGGGITIIGGGGDEILLSAKIQILSNFEGLKVWLQSSFARTDEFQKIVRANNLDRASVFDEKQLDRFYAFLLAAPLEPMTIREGTAKTAKNADEIKRVAGVFENADHGLYIRLSREQWNTAIPGFSVEGTRNLISAYLFAELFLAHLHREAR